MWEYNYTNQNDYLCHIGIPGRSGRYPWGSGARPYQRLGISVSKKVSSNRAKRLSKRNANMLTKETEKQINNFAKTANKQIDILSKSKAKAEEKIKKKENKKQIKTNKQNTSNKQENAPKSYKNMSDEELQTIIRRMQLEKQYRDLARDANPKKVSYGKVFVDSMLQGPVKQVSQDVVKYYLGQAVNKQIGAEVVNVAKKK